ncbi:MAG: MASE1 domain-containing protein, partial [Erythrobacter sp.]
MITRYDGPIATIWIPNAVVAAFLLHTAQDRQNPLLLIGMFAGSAGANTLAEFPTHHAFLFALANVIEIAIAVRLTRHWCGGRPKMDELDHLARFILAGGIIASASSGWCCQTNRNLSPIGARYPFPELVQAMRFCHSASA